MLRGYANGGQQASDSYIGALAEVLLQYPRCISAHAGDLVRGVPRETRFLPTPADVIAWCERETEDLRGIVHRDDYYTTLEQQQRERAAEAERLEAVRKARPTYNDLKAKHGENWGIGQQQTAEDRAAGEQRAARMAEANDTLLRREYDAAGEKPRQAAPGILVSRELAERLGARHQPQREAAE